MIIPTIVARKMASSCHATLVTPVGTGISHRMIPVAIEAVSGAIAAPTGGDLGGSGTDVDEAAAAAAALSLLLVVFFTERDVCLLGYDENSNVVVMMLFFRKMGALDLVMVEWRMDGGRTRRRREEVVRGRDAMSVWKWRRRRRRLERESIK